MSLKRRWSFKLTKHFVYSHNDSDRLEISLKCQLWQKARPIQHCDICHVSFSKACVPNHLIDKSRKHLIVPVTKKWSLKFLIYFSNKDGPVSNFQDAKPCHMCEKLETPWYYDLCNVNLFRDCAGRHHSDQFRLHGVVPKTQQSSFEISKHSSRHYHYVHSIQDIICHMCEDPTLHCNLCCINLCKACVRKRMFAKHWMHKIVTISKLWSIAKRICNQIGSCQEVCPLLPVWAA